MQNTFLLDLDGVTYRGDQAVPGAAEAIAMLRAAGHHILFATNNATKTRSEFVDKLGTVGIPATLADLATSASATASYLQAMTSPPATALVIGAPALAHELAAAGIRAVAIHGEPPEQPDCVVVSLDRQFTYQKMARAQMAVLAGAMLVATNKDPQFPSSSRLWPGAGSIVAAVEAACKQTAVAIGKPGPLLYKTLLKSSGADVARTIVVGDNLETDIAAAAAMGLPSVLVLTGVSRRGDIPLYPHAPTIVVDTLLELASYDLDRIFAGMATFR